ncbi:MAG: MFS transporter [Promethearchaeota archaeon]
MNEISKHTGNRKIILIAISLSSFLTAFSAYTTVISAKSIEIDLGMDVVTISWVTNIFILATAMFQIFFGKIGDVYGRKKVFLAGIILFLISSILLALTYMSNIFIIFRFIQGIGTALMFSTTNAILTANFPPNERGKVIGINVMCVYIGLTLSPLLGGLMTQYLGWRSQFWFNIPFSIIVICLILFKVDGEWKNEKREKIDYFGSIIFALFLFFLIYATTLFPNVIAYILLILSGIGITIFLFWEKRVNNPLLDLNLFRSNRYFSFSCMVSIFYYLSTNAIALVLSLLMQYLYNLTIFNAGIILSIAPLMQAVFSPIIGRLSDKMESRKLVSIGIIISLMGISILIFINYSFPIYLVFLSLGILGLGTAFFSPPNIRAIMSSTPTENLGIASGLEGTTRTIGQSLSFGLWTLMTGIIIGNVEITPIYYPQVMISARLIFIIYLILILFSLFFSVFRGRNRIEDYNIKK